MGTKPSNNFQSDRPESGGADKDDQRENSGLLERDKQKFASDQAKKGGKNEAGKGAGVDPASRK